MVAYLLAVRAPCSQPRARAHWTYNTFAPGALIVLALRPAVAGSNLEHRGETRSFVLALD